MSLVRYLILPLFLGCQLTPNPHRKDFRTSGDENQKQEYVPNSNKPQNPEPGVPEIPDTPLIPEKSQYNQMLVEVVRLTNEQRTRGGFAPLEIHQKLMETAQDWSETMARTRWLRHTRLQTFMNPTGAYTGGENIAQGQRSASEVVGSWMNSPGHKRNIMSSQFTHIGIGFKNGFWAQQFIGLR